MDELSQLAREIQKTCQDLNSSIEGLHDTGRSRDRPRRFSWRPSTHSNESIPDSNHSVTDSNDSFTRIEPTEYQGSALASLERKIDSVRADTSELLSRVPCDLKDLIEQAKESILIRVDSILHSNRSNDSVTQDVGLGKHATHSNHSQRSVAQQLEQLTPRERSVFRICFESGFLTYEELGARLGLSPIAAKNVVNAILRHPHKSDLLTKMGKAKQVRVGVPDEVSEEVLTAKSTKTGLKPTA